MPTISSAFYVSLILITADDFQGDLLACASVIRILNSLLLNTLILLYSHVIFAFFPNIKESIFSFN